MVFVDALFAVIASAHHGHVQAVRTAMQRLGFDALIAARPSRERDLVVAMVAARILEPESKLATTRWWHTTTLPASLGVGDADEDALYAAMDWPLARQDRIEAPRKLAPVCRAWRSPSTFPVATSVRAFRLMVDMRTPQCFEESASRGFPWRFLFHNKARGSAPSITSLSASLLRSAFTSPANLPPLGMPSRP
jgi:hypothetical protein